MPDHDYNNIELISSIQAICKVKQTIYKIEKQLQITDEQIDKY